MMRYAILSIVFFLMIGFVFAASNPGHPASELDPGTFGSGGGFIFPWTLIVNGTLSVNTIQSYSGGAIFFNNPLVIQNPNTVSVRNLVNCGKLWTDGSGLLTCGLDATANYTFITGLVQIGDDVMLVTSYRLPQGCANGQVAKSNGAGVWSCQNDLIGGSGNGNVNGSGTDYWIPRWNGTSGLTNSIMYQAFTGGINWVMYQGGINASGDICTRSGGSQKCLSSVGASFQAGPGIYINTSTTPNTIRMEFCGPGLIMKAGVGNSWSCAPDDLGSGSGGGNVTGSGTYYWIARWNGTTSLADSFMYQIYNGASNNWVMVSNAGINASGDICTRTGGSQKCLSTVGETYVSGTTNYISKFTSANTIGNSQITDDGTNVRIGNGASPGAKFSVNGTGLSTGILSIGNLYGILAQNQNPISMGGLGVNFMGGDYGLWAQNHAYIGGKLGINMQPDISAESLQVGGDIRATGNIKATRDINATGDICTARNGGKCLSTVGSNGWTDAGTVVSLTTLSDVVGMGANPSGTEKLRVAGDTVIDGSLTINNIIKSGSGDVIIQLG